MRFQNGVEIAIITGEFPYAKNLMLASSWRGELSQTKRQSGPSEG